MNTRRSFPRRALSLAVLQILMLGRLSTAQAAPTAGEAAELPAVQVSANAIPQDGQAAGGYRQRSSNLGPLGERQAIDTPFSSHAVSGELLRNHGAETYSEAVKYLPSAYVEGHFGLEIGPPIIRGFQGDDVAGSVRIDGLNVRADVPLPIELYDRLEVLNGPAAALYGPSPAAGMINARLKRPTETPLREIGIGYSGRGNPLLRADFGGRLGESATFGYRFNVLQADGEGYAAGSNLRRNLVGLALDARLSDSTLIEFLASHYDFNQQGYPGGFSYTNTTGLPKAPDPAKAGYGQSFGGVDSSIDLAELHAVQTLATGWRLSGALQKQIATREFNNPITNTFTNSSGSYKTTYRQSASRAEVLSNYLYLNGQLNGAGVSHDLALGTVGYQIDNYAIPGLRTAASALTLGNASLDNPVSYADPGWGGTGPRHKSGDTRVESLVLSDTLGFGENWSALLAANDSWIDSRNLNAAGATTSTYSKSNTWSYSASLLYKFRRDTSVYLTYADSVEPGQTASSTAANAYESLAPYRSREWELGIKGALAHLDWSAALFQVQRPFAYTDPSDNVFKSAGKQENKGAEFSLRGEPGKGLVIVGSMTWLDPRMTATANPAAEGKLVVGAPRVQGNLLAEYRLPEASGVTLEGNIHHAGRRAANLENTLWADAYTTYDIGARHEIRIGKQRLTTRLMVANLTDRHYWNSLYTGSGWSGGIGASGTAFLGEPRTVKLSMTMAF